MNGLVVSVLLCGYMVLPNTTADAQSRATQQNCSYIGKQTPTHTQVECDDNMGYLIDDESVSTYDTSAPMTVTMPQSSWLVFHPAPGSDSMVTVGWWNMQTQQLCALFGTDRARMTCADVEWPTS